MSNRKQKLIIIGALCLVVTLLSIGYAILSANLRINGTAKVSGEKWSVEFVEKQAKTIPKGKATCDIGTIQNTSVTNLSAKVKVPGDSCTFTIPVENTGTLDASLVDVTNRGLSLSYDGDPGDIDIISSYITYDVRYGNTEINNETSFDTIDILEPGERETITLRVEFKEEATQIPNDVVTITGLDRTFNFENKVGSSSETSPTPETVPVYHDTSGANQPVLSDNMIPVVYDETRKEWVKQDLDKSYDYSSQVWANAVTVVEDGTQTRSYYKKAKAGTVISMNDINTMWVWIPRYSYTIKSENGGINYYGKASSDNPSPSQELPGEIDIKFIPTSQNDSEGSAQYIEGEVSGWRTNDAFNFDNKNRAGLWTAKFETSGTIGDTCISETCDKSNIIIKPGMTSFTGPRLSRFFYGARSMQREDNQYGFSSTSGDIHMAKNDEWGAITYLSQSKYGKYGNEDYSGANKEVYINNSSSYITGNSGGTPNAAPASGLAYEYNNMSSLGDGTGHMGPGASTTGTIYGVYDMAGGATEYVMGILEYDAQNNNDNFGKLVTENSDFKGLNSSGEETGYINLPDAKYYNTYKSANPISTLWSTAKAENACDGGVCYGHALSETAQWYKGTDSFLVRISCFFHRGGIYDKKDTSSIFYVSVGSGDTSDSRSFRIVLTPNN